MSLNINFFDRKVMQGPTVLYELKPVYQIPQKLELPHCMYKMKNPVACVTTTSDHTDDEKEVLAGIMDKVKDILKKPLPELAALEKRWDSLLMQLSELKLQMESIRKSVTDSCKLAGYTLLDSKTLDKLKMFHGAVINASPTSPPYFLILLKHLYSSSVPISISSHVHSSVQSLPDSLDCFTKLTDDADAALKLVLIWKNDITDTELVFNPVKQLPIKGEVNILRLFARSGLELLQYPSSDLVDTIQMDSVLDTSHRLLHVKNAKERASLFRGLNAKLGKHLYFGGDEINICDISVWSALKQINVYPAQDLSQTMAKWYKRVDEILF